MKPHIEPSESTAFNVVSYRHKFWEINFKNQMHTRDIVKFEKLPRFGPHSVNYLAS